MLKNAYNAHRRLPRQKSQGFPLPVSHKHIFKLSCTYLLSALPRMDSFSLESLWIVPMILPSILCYLWDYLDSYFAP